MRFRQLASHLFGDRFFRSFSFLDPGPLIDGELELVAPDPALVSAVLESCRDPMTLQQAPALAAMSRPQLDEFLRLSPAGHQPAVADMLPTYHFWMRLALPEKSSRPTLSEPGESNRPIAGAIAVRIGNTYDTVIYYGHIGYHVFPRWRGRHLAERSTRLLFPLCRRHGLDPLWITCNPDNAPSRITCERLGGQMIQIVPVPQGHPLQLAGDREKCRFRVDLNSGGA